MLDHPVNSITVSCTANAIPENLTHDVSELEVGQSVHVSDLDLPNGVTAVTDEGTMVAHVVVSSGAASDADEETTDGEPEVIGAKDDEAAAE